MDILHEMILSNRRRRRQNAYSNHASHTQPQRRKVRRSLSHHHWKRKKKLYSFTKRLCLSYFLHTNFSFLRKTIKRMCEWLENWTGPEATCFPIWKLENSKNDTFKNLVFNVINFLSSNLQCQKLVLLTFKIHRTDFLHTF